MAEPVRAQLARPVVQPGEQLAKVGQLGREGLDATQLGRDLRQRRSLVGQLAQAPLARLDLRLQRPRPGVGLLAQGPELGLRCRPLGERLPQARGQRRVELPLHCGVARQILEAATADAGYDAPELPRVTVYAVVSLAATLWIAPAHAAATAT